MITYRFCKTKCKLFIMLSVEEWNDIPNEFFIKLIMSKMMPKGLNIIKATNYIQTDINPKFLRKNFT